MLDYRALLHVTREDQQHSCHILEIAQRLGCRTYLLRASDTQPSEILKGWPNAVYYFDIDSAITHVPARHLRLLRSRDYEPGRVSIPSWIDPERMSLGRIVAVTNHTGPEPLHSQRRREALINLHRDHLGRPAEPKISKVAHVIRTTWRVRGRRNKDASVGGWL